MRKLHHLPLLSLIAALVACGGESTPDREPQSVPTSAAPAAAGQDSRPTASKGTGVPFLLESGFIYTGETPIVHFDRPVPTEGGRYWITVVDAAKADDKWGTWPYIDTGATEVPLSAVNTPGWYEVRLHGRYPEFSTHLISRAVLEVVEDPTGAAPSRPASTESASRDDFSQPVAGDPNAGTTPSTGCRSCPNRRFWSWSAHQWPSWSRTIVPAGTTRTSIPTILASRPAPSSTRPQAFT